MIRYNYYSAYSYIRSYALTGPGSKNSVSVMMSVWSRVPVTQYLAGRLELSSRCKAILALSVCACPVAVATSLCMSSSPLQAVQY